MVVSTVPVVTVAGDILDDFPETGEATDVAMVGDGLGTAFSYDLEASFTFESFFSATSNSANFFSTIPGDGIVPNESFAPAENGAVRQTITRGGAGLSELSEAFFRVRPKLR